MDIVEYLENEAYEKLREDVASSERTWENFKGIKFALGMFAS